MSTQAAIRLAPGRSPRTPPEMATPNGFKLSRRAASETPASHDPALTAALPGNSKRTTTLCLNRCPYRAASTLLDRRSYRSYPGDNHPDVGRAAQAVAAVVARLWRLRHRG
jgi:hypothetical protein